MIPYHDLTLHVKVISTISTAVNKKILLAFGFIQTKLVNILRKGWVKLMPRNNDPMAMQIKRTHCSHCHWPIGGRQMLKQCL